MKGDASVNSNGAERGFPPEIMTIEQAADYLQLHPQVVYRHVRAGTLPASRIGRTIRFKRSVLDSFLERGAWAFANSFLTYVDAAKAARPAPRAATVMTPAAPHTTNAATPEPARGPFSVDVD